MADLKKSRSINVEGNFFVDSTCIDCGTCYWIAKETFERESGMSRVFHQPSSKKEVIVAYQALYSCPTNSIGVKSRESIATQVLASFPVKLHENVFHTGFHAESSYGAASYFIKDQFCNILLDSPRYTKKLSSAFQDLGGIDLYLLSHKDDIADTNRYWEDFSGKRMIHIEDKTTKSKNYEHFFQDEDEVRINGHMVMIPVPGHTKGSVCYLYKDKFLFTGDHLAFSPSLGHLYAFKNACWYNFSKQILSMEKLLDYSFEFVLPGHGHPYRATKSQMRDSLKKCIQWMKND